MLSRFVSELAKLPGRIEEGIALLDFERGPQWVHEIDTDTYSITSCVDCTLGQLYGDFRSGMRKLGIPDSSMGEGYGFAAGDTWEEDEVWAVLNHLQIARIKELQAERKENN